MDDFEGHPLSVARARRNLTQKGLAIKAGVGRATVWRAEHGYPINAVSRQRLCDFFDMTARELGLIGRNYLHAENKPASKKATGEATTATATAPASFLHKEAPPVRYTPFQAIDLLSETPNVPSEQLAGAWLTLGASHLGQLFENGWSLEGILGSLRVVLQGVQGISMLARRRLLQLGGAAAIGGIGLPKGEDISEEERLQLHICLGKSIEKAWNLFLRSNMQQVLAIGQAHLSLLQQAYHLLDPDARASYYSAVYRLIGASAFFQARYGEALQFHKLAYLTALEAGDSWNMAESLGWQSGIWKACGWQDKAIQTTEGALRLASASNDRHFVITRARLLAQWAESAALMHKSKVVDEKLEASASALNLTEPNEEFDASIWQYYRGTCRLYLGDASHADAYFQKALQEHHSDWILHRTITTLLQAEAQLKMGRLEESLKTARSSLPMIIMIDSPLLSYGLVDYTQALAARFSFHPDLKIFSQDIQAQLSLPAQRTIPKYLEATL